ncbi:MAG: hypothetical protein HY263_10865 [Chloroflexi bacterium]|nr:hypothetical protein [Chloroflexota bacterium]
MNSYVEIQMRLVAERQQAYRVEADDARLLATASPLPAVSAGSRAAATAWPADGEPIAMSSRSLGAAAAAERTSGREVHPITKPHATKPQGCGEHAAAA